MQTAAARNVRALIADNMRVILLKSSYLNCIGSALCVCAMFFVSLRTRHEHMCDYTGPAVGGTSNATSDDLSNPARLNTRSAHT